MHTKKDERINISRCEVTEFFKGFVNDKKGIKLSAV